MALTVGLDSPMFVRIPGLRQLGQEQVEGELVVPAECRGIALIVHGRRSSRFSPRNRSVARTLRQLGIGTFLIDLAPPQEIGSLESPIETTRTDLMSRKIVAASRWLQRQQEATGLPIGMLGAGTGAAAALMAVANYPEIAQALVLRGARVELAADVLGRVSTPTLLLVGSKDTAVAELNRAAIDKLGCRHKQFELVPGASHSFAEPGALAAVAFKTSNWFFTHLSPTDLIEAASPQRYAYIEPGGIV